MMGIAEPGPRARPKDKKREKNRKKERETLMSLKKQVKKKKKKNENNNNNTEGIETDRFLLLSSSSHISETKKKEKRAACLNVLTSISPTCARFSLRPRAVAERVNGRTGERIPRDDWACLIILCWLALLFSSLFISLSLSLSLFLLRLPFLPVVRPFLFYSHSTSSFFFRLSSSFISPLSLLSLSTRLSIRFRSRPAHHIDLGLFRVSYV